jgi:tetratricopeptide (TPR) repeat protein
MLLRSSLLVTALALTTVRLPAQGGCVIVEDKPFQLAGVKRYYNGIVNGRSDEKIVHFRRALGQLVDSSANIDNQIGRYYWIGRVYYGYLNYVPGATDITTREQVGFDSNPSGVHDIFAAADSAFTKVEELNPACEAQIRPLRANIYGTVYNKAKAALDKQKYDSAEALAMRALVASPKAGAPWNMIAKARQERGDTAGMIEAMKKVIEAGKTDKAMASQRDQALYNLGVLELNRAQRLPKDSPEQVAKAKEAAAYFEQLIKDKPDDASAKSALGTAQVLSGNKEAAEGVFQSMLNEPEKFKDVQLFEAGANAYATGRIPESIRLIESGLAKNPYNRTGLFNLTAALAKAEQFDAMIAGVRRLVAIDPSNTENYIQAIAAWQGAVRKGIDSLAKLAPDTIMYYFKLRDSATVQVKFNPFQPTGRGDAVLDGVIENRGAAVKTYELTVEFLDTKGVVVDTQHVTVSDVAPKTAKQVRVTTKAQGTAAYRYKPLS